MDNLTHTAVGLFLSRAGLNRWCPHSTAILLIAANIPDVDVFAVLGGSTSYLHYHRHWTHSLLAMPLMALLAVALMRVAFRATLPWRKAFAVAFIGVASHILLDLTNTYGVRILLPFSSEWFHFDIAGFPDPWAWTILLLGIVGPFLSRLVGSEIASGGKRVRHHGRGGAIFALSLLALYDGGRAVLHTRAIGVLESRNYRGMAPVRVAAFPVSTNPLRWRGVVETADFQVLVPVNLLEEFDPAQGRILDRPDPSPALDRARATPVFQEFLRFSQFPMWRVWPDEKIENGTHVEAIDLRFGSQASPSLFARARVDSNGKVVESAFHYW